MEKLVRRENVYIGMKVKRNPESKNWSKEIYQKQDKDTQYGVIQSYGTGDTTVRWVKNDNTISQDFIYSLTYANNEWDADKPELVVYEEFDLEKTEFYLNKLEEKLKQQDNGKD